MSRALVWIALVLLAALVAASAFSAESPHRAIDGDTIDLRIRLANIDAPELRGACARERDLARAAARTVADLLAGARSVYVQVNTPSIDRYGRVLATVAIDGRDIGETLISRGLAHPWRGSRAKSGGWCD